MAKELSVREKFVKLQEAMFAKADELAKVKEQLNGLRIDYQQLIKSLDPEARELFVVAGGSGGRRPGAGRKAGPAADKLQDDIRTYLKSNGTATFGDMDLSVTPQQFKRAIDPLVADGEVKKTGQGRGVKYALAK